MDLLEAVFDKEVFREELKTQKLKVAKLEEQNLEIPEIRQERKDSRTMVHAKDVETQKFGSNSRNIKDVTRDFASTKMIWQKNLRRTSTIGRSHRRHEQDLKSLATLKIY
jgi:hypothetical protein